MKALTLRVEDDIHKRIKIKAIEKGVTIQSYILSLVMADLENRKGHKNV